MKNKDISGKTLEDVGISVLLIALFAATMVGALSDRALFNENLVMTIVSFVAVLLAAIGVTSIPVIIASLATICYIAYKIYQVFMMDAQIPGISYLWIAIPGLSVLGISLFIKGVQRLQRDNNILSKQVEDLIMIDPLTGFYNLRSMYMDIQTQISYAERNNKQISLMIIRPRYRKELKDVLKKSQYESVIVNLSKIVYDTVRLEDKVYSLDGDGTVGVLLTCDRQGAKLVEKRIRGKIDSTDAFNSIAEKPIRMEIQLGFLEYKKEYNRDAIQFKSLVEEEVAYDL
ncbi:MAG: diguanylate cyclase [Lachnospiraceae bacterium]|nr:diguanylate cyclase [Lachnospiraceae bacterium]